MGSENAAKSAEDLGAAEDKVAHLNQIKSKLESTLDELEGSLEKEKRGRANVEKERRKVEGELKVIKENQAHVEELEEELEAERQARAKAERQRSDLARELENMGERLGEASGATSAQIELNKKREAEVTKLRRDLEEAHIQQEATLVSLKKKHQDAIAEMSEQIEQLNKMKNKVEKDKTLIMREIADARAAVDEVNRSKAASEKTHRNLLSTLNDQSKKIEEATLTLNDMEGSKRKIAAENAGLLGQFRNAEHEVAGMQDHYQEEISAKENLGRSLNKALGEADMLRVRYEKEGVAKAEELEMAKLKMQARLSEADSTADQLKAKLAQLDKARAKLASDLE